MIDNSYNVMSYTVNQLAKLAGISVRTLHYYDELSLLKPAFLAKNGYRNYGDSELIRLQQIMFFRELDFSLEEIKSILDDPRFNLIEALKDQRKLLELKQKRTDRLIKSINQTIESMTDNKPLNGSDLYDPFKDEDIKEYQDEVKERWGNTDAYKQSMARVSRMTKQEMNKLKEDGKKFTQTIADNMSKGAEHPDVQELIAQHYKSVNFFYDCNLEIYRNLGQMYVDDPRFAAYYEKFAPGLALFMRNAIAYYCDQNK